MPFDLAPDVGLRPVAPAVATPVAPSRRCRGARNHLAGLCAEDGVRRCYARLGCRILARRWRGPRGEIDLVAEAPDGTLVFIEVKSARSHALAAGSLTMRQLRRIFDTAEDYVARTLGRLEVPMRFDLALVDQTGQVELVANLCL